MPTFYLSFADEDGWIGAAFLDAMDPASAVIASHMLGCNPGGEVIIVDLDARSTAGVGPDDKARLLDKADLARIGEQIEPGGGALVEGTPDELGAQAEAVRRSREQ